MCHSLIIHSPTKSHLLGWFQVLAIIKKGLFFSASETWLLPTCHCAKDPCEIKLLKVEWKQGDRMLQLSVRTHCSEISIQGLHMNAEKIPKDLLFLQFNILLILLFSVFITWHIWLAYISIFFLSSASYILQEIYLQRYQWNKVGG